MHEIETCFSLRETPWHGLGTILQNEPSIEEALIASGLNWKVIKKPIYLDNKIPIPNNFANVRDSDNSVLGIVSDQYQIVQNTEAFAFVDELLKLTEFNFETAGALYKGKKIWVLAKLKDFEILGDKIDNYICFVNTHDGTGSVRVVLTPTRVVCNNTLNIALSNATKSWSCMHKGEVQHRLAVAQKVIDNNIRYVSKLKSEAENLQNINLNTDQERKILCEIVNYNEDDTERVIKNKELVMDQILQLTYAPDLQKFGRTGWTFINAVSDFMSHKVPLRQTANFAQNNWNYIMSYDTIVDKTYQILTWK